MIPLAVALFLAATMFCGYQIGGQWPHELRDRYLRMAGALAAALTVWMEPGLGMLLALAVLRWRSPETLPPVLIFGSASGLYALIRAGGPDTHAAVQAMLVATALLQAAWATHDLLWVGRHKLRLTLHQARELGRGTMGNRLYVGAVCALAAPLAPWWALPGLAWGLLITNTYTGVAAAVLGLAVAHPDWTPWIALAVLPPAPFVLWWRGHPRDSLRGRAHVWRLALATWAHAGWHQWLCGFGHGAFPILGRWWSARGWTQQHYRQAHSDPVQVTVEWGALGLLAVGCWVGNVARHAAWGDPVTGAFVTGLTLALTAFPSYLPHPAVALLSVAAMLSAR